MLKLLKNIVLLILFIATILIFINIHVLVLEDVQNNKTIFIVKVNPNDEFTMTWMHSVELQPWEEIFRIDDDYHVILDRTRFKSFGAGVPDYAGDKSEVKDGYVIFSGINKKMNDLQYGISDFAKHTFNFSDKELRLYEHIEDGNAIKIYTKPLNMLEYFIKKAASI
ncbi:MAG: DUF1850 domain-containing protein [Maledivibacter sp.]|jgi:hypothetical protein|nr:DUF1850 domain-containing protein [Maledivibacter sp.]